MPTKTKQTLGAIEPERMYTYAEVADLIGVSERRVRGWVDDGEMGFVQLPRGRRILGRHYAAFIASRSVEV